MNLHKQREYMEKNNLISQQYKWNELEDALWKDPIQRKQHRYWLNKTYYSFHQWPLFASDEFTTNPFNYWLKKKQIGWI